MEKIKKCWSVEKNLELTYKYLMKKNKQCFAWCTWIIGRFKTLKHLV